MSMERCAGNMARKTAKRNCYITYTCPLCEANDFENAPLNTLSLEDLKNIEDYGGLSAYLKKERKHSSLEECIVALRNMLKNHTHSGISL